MMASSSTTPAVRVKREPGLSSPPPDLDRSDLKRKELEDPGSSQSHRVKDETEVVPLAFDKRASTSLIKRNFTSYLR